ncbi:MAG: DtxR family transcriptional regulator, Mn-dependent transcriptional regulator [Frankiales bacterium]|nr:DtxR family transcriptional regulator, Mn-dependent transcriptional regulator [Frankiales bacterium]
MSAVGDTTETTQMYLRTVLELELAGVPALRARLVERLHHSAPAVSQTVAKLAGDGLLELNEPDRTLSLTDVGRKVASSVLSKHVLAEQMLTTLIGLDPASAHAEACNWEHVISDDVEAKLRLRFGPAERCPFTGPGGLVSQVDISTPTQSRTATASAAG